MVVRIARVREDGSIRSGIVDIGFGIRSPDLFVPDLECCYFSAFPHSAATRSAAFSQCHAWSAGYTECRVSECLVLSAIPLVLHFDKSQSTRWQSFGWVKDMLNENSSAFLNLWLSFVSK